MAVEISWYVPGAILYIRYGTTVSKDDVLLSYQSIENYAKEAGKPIHVIMDSLQVQLMDFSLKEVRDALVGFESTSMIWGVNLTSADPMSSRAGSFVLAILNQGLGLRYRTYKTLEESHAFFLELEPALEGKLPVLD